MEEYDYLSLDELIQYFKREVEYLQKKLKPIISRVNKCITKYDLKKLLKKMKKAN